MNGFLVSAYPAPRNFHPTVSSRNKQREKDMTDTAVKQEIDRLLEVEVQGFGVGIFGREWCECCGRLTSFDGFNLAMLTHFASRFVCGACTQKLCQEDHSLGFLETLVALVQKRGFRYCEGCGEKVPIKETTREEIRRAVFTCPDCEVPDRGEAGRRRYLENEATRPGGLKRVTARVRNAKAGLEWILQ